MPDESYEPYFIDGVPANKLARELPDTQSLTDQIKAIPWASWVKWVAHSFDGLYTAFESEPVETKYGFVSSNKKTLREDIEIINLPTFPDWRESKIRVND